MSSILDVIAYSLRTQYSFYGYGVDFVSTPRITGGGAYISTKYPKEGKYKNRVLTMYTNEAGPVDAVQALMFHSDLMKPDLDHPAEGYYDDAAFDLTKNSEKLQKIVSETPIIVADLEYPNAGYARISAPYPDHTWAGMPKFFFNSEFIPADEAETLAVENLKEASSYKSNSFFQLFAPISSFTKEGDKEWRAEQMLDCVKNHRNKAAEENKEALFVCVAGKTIVNFRKGIDHMLEYVDGAWSTIDPETKKARSLVTPV